MRTKRIEFEECNRTRTLGGPYTTDTILCRVWVDREEQAAPERVALDRPTVDMLNRLPKHINSELWFGFEVTRVLHRQLARQENVA